MTITPRDGFNWHRGQGVEKQINMKIHMYSHRHKHMCTHDIFMQNQQLLTEKWNIHTSELVLQAPFQPEVVTFF